MRVETNPAALIPQREVGTGTASGMRKPSLAVDYYALLSYARGVPMLLDEAQRKWGRDIYNIMRRDAAVNGGFRKWKQEVLAEEFRIIPPKGHSKDPNALKLCDFLNRCVDRLDMRIEDLGWQMLDAGAEGHVLTEITWKQGTGMDAGFEVLDSLRPIPHDLYVIVQDAYGKFLGVIGWVPGHFPLLWEGPILMPLDAIPGFIPAWKFALMTHDAKIGGLMGRSRFEAAYNPYAIKYKNWALFLQYLVRFAGPIPVGEVSPDASVRDPSKTPEQEMGEFLSMLEEMGAAGVPAGTNLKFLTATGGEKVFTEAIKTCNNEIVTSILGNTRSMLEAENGSKADSESGQNSVDDDTAYTGKLLCDVITRQVFRPLIISNFGENAPCPVLTLSSDQDQFAANGPVVAALYTAPNAVSDNQEAQLWEKVGIDPPAVPLSERRKKAQEELGGNESEPGQGTPDAPATRPDGKKPKSIWHIPFKLFHRSLLIFVLCARRAF